MSDRDDIRQPLDHLPPQEEGGEIEQPHYPGTGEAEAGSPVSPDTAAEPDKADRHGVAKLPPTDR